MSAATTGERSFPPIAWLTTSALALVIIGGILVASYAPRHAPLGVVGALLGVALAVRICGVFGDRLHLGDSAHKMALGSLQELVLGRRCQVHPKNLSRSRKSVGQVPGNGLLISSIKRDE